MTPNDSNQMERIFHEALDRDVASERAAYLDGACGADLHLRARVDALLKAHAEANEFLEESAVNPDQATVSEGPGSRIGNFKLLQMIGEGGMGVVYMAEQAKPVQRKVALKIIKLGMDTKQVIARFEVERQALAMMDHPNIAKVLDAGATETGRPYFVMELVRGVAINEYCDTHNLSMRERLGLFIDVCHAIQHAHQKGIIHRDIKPSNVLVTAHDGRPVPKIIDFGVAKATNQRLTEMTLFTEFHQFIGTPEYMSPEQAEMSGLDVDTRSDVYSLGVLLYHLLTGTTPVDPVTLREAGYQNMQQVIREQEATAPSTLIGKMGDASTGIAKNRGTDPNVLQSLLRGDLDWIVMKALEKDRTRRYETVASMADDVERHLNNLPVLAGRPSSIYKLNKFVRRNKVPVVAGSVAVLAILAGLAAALTGFWRASAAAERSLMISDTLQDLLISVDPGQAASSSVDVQRLLERAREAFGAEHAAVAATLNNLAGQLHNSGDLEGAEPLYRESIRLWENIYGKAHLNVALTRGRLGSLLGSKGDTQGAELALREALSILDGIPDAPAIAGSPLRVQLAQILDRGGDREQAGALFQQAITAYESDPEAHRYTLIATREQYLHVLLSDPDKTRALEVVKQIYDEVRVAYDEGSIYHKASAVGLGNMLSEAGRAEEAEPYYREVLEHCRADPKPHDIYRLISLDRLFQIMRSRTDPDGMDEADELLAECIIECADKWSPRKMVETMNHLADRVRGRALHDRALEPASQALALAKSSDSGSGAIASLSELLAHDALYVAVSAEQDAAAYERALQAVEELLLDEPDHAGYAVVLGGLLHRSGQTEMAQELLAGIDPAMIEDGQGEIFASAAAVKPGFEALIAYALRQPDAANAHLDRLIENERTSSLATGPLRALVAEVRHTLDRQD